MFSSPFDVTAVDLLEDLNASAYKVASFEVIDLPLIRYVASTGKPMIISTGMADMDEIADAVAAARDRGCKELALLHCVSGHSAPAKDYNLATIPDMAKRFGVSIGLCDHTIDNVTAIAGVALGDTLIEKHFTLDRAGGGPDDSFSLEPSEFASFCEGAKIAWAAVGRVSYQKKESEKGNVKFRRSLYFVNHLERGAFITEQDVLSVRPGFGLALKFLDPIIGARTMCEVSANTPVTRDNVELYA